MNTIHAWSHFAVGDFFSRILALNDDNEKWVRIFYSLYNHHMIRSFQIQEQFGLEGPWYSK